MAGEISARSLTKFDGKNFQYWKFQITSALVANDLLGYVDGTKARPNNLTNDEGTTWTRQDAKAKYLLSASIEPEQMESLLVCTTSKEMWDTLLVIHEQRSESHKLLMSQRFHEYRMDSNDTVVQHIAKVQNLARQLIDIGENIPDLVVMSKILASLPLKYRHFRTSWGTMEPGRQTIDLLKARLIEEEGYLNADEVEATALAATTRKVTSGGQKPAQKKKVFEKRKNNVKCYVCSEKGHYARECPKRTNKHATQDNNESNCALIASSKGAKGHGQGDCRAGSQICLSEPTAEQRKTTLNANQDEAWFTDSGASAHITFRRDWLVSYRPKCDGSTIVLGDDRECAVVGEGTVHVKRLINNKWVDAQIHDVLYVPEMGKNLYSVGLCTTRGLEVQFKNDLVKVRRDGEVIVVGVKQSNQVYRMCIRVEPPMKQEVNAAVADIRTWHERMGHINVRSLKDLELKELVDGVRIKDSGEFVCESCKLSKSHKLPFKKEVVRSTRPGEMFHSDVCGPMQETSLGGARYYVTFIDDATSFRHVYCIKHKSDVVERLIAFEKLIRNRFGRSMKTLRSDNGLEYVNSQLKSFLESKGIVHERTAPYTPEQNGKAERENRTIMECARTLLNSAGLPRSLWAEAVNTSAYLLNRVSTPTRDKSKTSYELWTTKKPDLSHLRVFGSTAYKLVPKLQAKKLDDQAVRTVLVGYEEESTNYRLYCPNSRKVTVARHVEFDETGRRVEGSKHAVDDDYLLLSTPVAEIHENPPGVPIPQENVDQVEEEAEAPPRRARQRPPVPPPRELQLRDRTKLEKPKRYLANFSTLTTPETYSEAVNGPNAAKWRKAIRKELDAHQRNGTWTLVPREPKQKTIKSKWVFKVVRNQADAASEEPKARLCAKGFMQREGHDYTETFSPVVRYDSLRVLLAHITAEDLEMISFDVCTAFLYGELQERILMEVPEGVEVNCEVSGSVVCELKKSLYGLKQAPRCWNAKFKSFLYRFNFKECEADRCVFVSEYGDHKIYLALFVDDGLLASSSVVSLNKILSEFKKEFSITVGDASYFVGLQIQRNRVNKTMFVNQSMYLEQTLEKYGMNESKPMCVPADHNVKLQSADPECKRECVAPYREAIGSLMFMAIVSRPDIAYSVNLLSKYLNNFDVNHWNAVKRVLAYLSGSRDVGLMYRQTGDESPVVGYSDADFASDVDTRRSTTGYVFCMSGGPVTWSSQRQKLVTLSTTESEYVAAAAAAKEVCWLRKLLSGIGYRCDKRTVLYVDNQSAIKLVKNPQFHKRTKHIDIRYHFIREKHESGELEVKYVPSESQLADIYTKALPRDRFLYLRDSLGIISESSYMQ